VNSVDTYPNFIAQTQQPASETCEAKPASLFQRIEALIDRAFELAFGDDEKTILNSLHGL
jgi:hypothetical protein